MKNRDTKAERDESEQYIRKTLEISPDFWLAYERLSAVCHKDGRLAEACEAAVEEIRRVPRVRRPYEIIKICAKDRRFKPGELPPSVMAVLEQTQESYPYMVCFVRAVLSSRERSEPDGDGQGLWQEAEMRARERVERSPKSWLVLEDLAEILLMQGKALEGGKWAERVLGIEPRSVRAPRLIANAICMKKKGWSTLEESLSKAIQAAPTNYEIYGARSNLYFYSDRKVEMLRDMEKAREIKIQLGLDASSIDQWFENYRDSQGSPTEVEDF
jgi:tetratricopeptide (TPR) repeat protein